MPAEQIEQYEVQQKTDRKVRARPIARRTPLYDYARDLFLFFLNVLVCLHTIWQKGSGTLLHCAGNPGTLQQSRITRAKTRCCTQSNGVVSYQKGLT
jgi:hypothetical protein